MYSQDEYDTWSEEIQDFWWHHEKQCMWKHILKHKWDTVSNCEIVTVLVFSCDYLKLLLFQTTIRVQVTQNMNH